MNSLIVVLNNVPSEIWIDLDLHISNFKYNKELFALGRKNIFLDPPVMKIFWQNVKKECLLIYQEVYQQVINSPDFKCDGSKEYVLARCYQTYASFLREMDVARKILNSASGFLVKYLEEDLNQGIDFRFTRYSDGRMFEFAVKVSGKTSEHFDAKRKNIKRSKNLIDLVAQDGRNNSMYLVSEEDIERILNG